VGLLRILGFNKPLYILPLNRRGSFQKKMFGWDGELSAHQTAEISAAKQMIYEGLRTVVAAGAPKHKAGILVDEQFGAAILTHATAQGRYNAITQKALPLNRRQAARLKRLSEYLRCGGSMPRERTVAEVTRR